ncbi:MAG: CoA transferase, partial [Acidobacteria bacterium]|nr:CoA transferase [Acidobacteriota bacterium]
MKPLEGLRVVELATYVAGPSCGMTLAQLGAQVIRVDPIGGAPDVRRLPVDANGNSLYWAGLNKGKRSIEVDLSSPAGQQIVIDLLTDPYPGGGILVTNAAQPWLTPDALAARPDVIQVRLLGRPDGTPAVDYTVNSEVGLPDMTGPVSHAGPVNHVLPAWDLLAGVQAALAVLAAERVRSRTGEGQTVTLALSDVAAAAMANLGYVADVVVNGRARERDGTYLYGSYGVDFACSDGRRVMVVALTSRHWKNLVAMCGVGDAVASLAAALGVDFAAEEARFEYRNLLTALLEPWFKCQSFADVCAALEKAKVLWGVYRTIDEFVHDP